MEDMLYWVIEYLKVFLGYGFLMFIWPSIVFRKYLMGKGKTFRFAFCNVMQIVLISTIVLMLGIFHILNKWTFGILFWGILIWSLRDKFKLTEDAKKKIKYLITGTFGWKHFLVLCRDKAIKNIKEAWKTLIKAYKTHWLEYSMLLIAVCYGMLYFSWGVFHDNSYCFSDMYVHHSWIYNISQGKVFAGGIYPQGMHCIIYAVSELFNIRIYSCMLFIPGMVMGIILISAYCLMKELFKWRYSAVFAIYIFLTMELTSRIFMISMARAQCALPQEYGFPAVLLCALFLLKYLKEQIDNKNVKKEKLLSKNINDNLLVFVLSFASTIIIHFYTTILAFYMCLGIALVCIKRIFNKTRFISLVKAVIIGLVIAATPMVVGFVSGMPLEGSLYWAMSVIRGSTSNAVEEDIIYPEDVSIELNVEQSNVVVGESETTQSQVITPNEDVSDTIYNDSSVVNTQEQVQVSFVAKIKAIFAQVANVIKEKLSIMYHKGVYLMYEEQRANTLVFLSFGILLLGILYKIIASFLCLFKKINLEQTEFFGGYFIIIAITVIYIISYVSGDLGMPMLMETYRSGFFNHMFVVMIVVIPLDIICMILNHFLWAGDMMHYISFGIGCSIIALIIGTDNYHGFLYFEVTRYDKVVELTNDIIDSMPQNSFTIVSPTDELYQVIEYGRHEEILTFCQRQSADKYTLPTEYVFIFVEKKPLRYAQYHFFDGPAWLGVGKYQEIYGLHSVWPEYLSSQISEEEANKNILYYAKESDSYRLIESRTILESKMYAWCEQFARLYPNELKTYYEDDDLVCYYFKQNTKSLYNLSFRNLNK